MKRQRTIGNPTSQNRLVVDLGRDIIRLAAQEEGLNDWTDRHGTAHAFAYDLFGEEDEDGLGVLLASAMVIEQDRAKRREREDRQAGLFLEKPSDELMYPPEDPRRRR